MSIEKIPPWIRWAFLPVASPLTLVIVSIVATIGSKLLVFIGGERGWSENFYSYLLVPGISGYFAVMVTYVLAPNGKIKAAMVFALIWIAVCGYISFIFVASGQWKSLLFPISMTVGCALAVLGSRE